MAEDGTGNAPVAPFVTLASNDGFSFIVQRNVAYGSATLKRMLDPLSNFAEARSGRIEFNDISGVVLEKVVEYLYFALKFKDSTNPPKLDIPPEICLEVLVAADYLNL